MLEILLTWPTSESIYYFYLFVFFIYLFICCFIFGRVSVVMELHEIQLAESATVGIREVIGSNPVHAIKPEFFFQLFFFLNCLSCVHNCDGLSFIKNCYKIKREKKFIIKKALQLQL